MVDLTSRQLLSLLLASPPGRLKEVDQIKVEVVSVFCIKTRSKHPHGILLFHQNSSTSKMNANGYSSATRMRKLLSSAFTLPVKATSPIPSSHGMRISSTSFHRKLSRLKPRDLLWCHLEITTPG